MSESSSLIKVGRRTVLPLVGASSVFVSLSALVVAILARLLLLFSLTYSGKPKLINSKFSRACQKKNKAKHVTSTAVSVLFQLPL